MLKTLSVLFVFSILSLNLFALELEEAAEQVNNVNLSASTRGKLLYKIYSCLCQRHINSSSTIAFNYIKG